MPEYRWITDQIFTVAKFFTPAECEAFIEQAESLGFTDAPIDSLLGPQLRQDIRNNSRVMLDDPRQAADLWSRIQNYIPLSLGGRTACGVNERFRIYRYDLGQQFDWHLDGSFERENGDCSQITFMIYLNEGFTGGETAFDSETIQPEQGLALFFRHQLRHKGMPVLAGRKYVLRTDVMYRRRT